MMKIPRNQIMLCCLFVLMFISTVMISKQQYKTTKLNSQPHENAPLQRFYFNSSTTTNKPTSTQMAETFKNCSKQVYTWIDISDRFHVDLIFKGRPREFSCPAIPCDVTVAFGTNVTELAVSDIIFLFYKSSWDWDTLMRHRKSHQKWVFWTSESPRHTNRRVIPPPQYADVYDYAMTYRTGIEDQAAVLLGSYGEYHKSVLSAGANESEIWAENKSKMVAWVSTNCHPHTLSWKRTEFVHTLSRLVGVDIYGPCGNLTCNNIETCGLQKYKFYLALENSECRDYITEKFWRNSLALGLVPIVYGAPKEDYLKVAPPNSFIFVRDFENLADLADYLKILDRNDALYNQYFEWRKHSSVSYHIQFSNFDNDFLCNNVVKTIMEDEKKEAARGRSRTKPVLPNLTEWWANSCRADHKDLP